MAGDPMEFLDVSDDDLPHDPEAHLFDDMAEGASETGVPIPSVAGAEERAWAGES